MASLEQFGLDVGIYGPLAQPETITTLAQFAESAGFESIWLADHVVFPTAFASQYPFSADGRFPAPTADPLLEPIAAMGVLAGATSRVKIGTAVLIIPYRNPVLLARMLITIDQFSGGRVILGAGVGWLREEFEVLDTADFALRGKATDEYLEIFKAMSAGGAVAYEGETYRFPPVHSVPGSVQRPHPPVLIGGVSNPALRRVARNDGWLAVALGRNEMPERLAALQRICAEQGRRFDDLQRVYKIFIAPGEPKVGPFGTRDMGSGSEAQIVDDLKAILDAGFQKIIVRYRGDSAAAQMEQMDRFADAIVPKL
ncbi:MAG: TIGR03619 family F420-dependent LLM class oxidoreductase [Alphaproteobacteria bacterium]|nr:TIGR03619 family F420-dependent LLM class oxidoreductase [Alphaproteobacteria bacterium]MCB9930142.1 TIGR03619 family F420-dependent LLM class oxidoreductase [Alphaproteobacteria bacterium]